MKRFAGGLLLLVHASCAGLAPAPDPPAAAGAPEPPRAVPAPGASAPPSAGAVAVARGSSGVPAVPAVPPYDLAADLRERTKRLREEVGPKTRIEVVDGVFLVAAPSGNVRGSAAVGKTALAAYFNGRFSRRPEKAVVVLLFDGAAPYDAYCEARWGAACSTPYGFYRRDERAVVMNVAPGIGTLTHELVHPILESDFPGAPDWIDEGIASLYEAFRFPRPGEIRGTKNFRLPALKRALAAPPGEPRPSLGRLFAMGDAEFRGADEALNYAAARYFCQWMDEKNKLWPFYHAWRDGNAGDPTGEKAFAATMGSPAAALDAAWVAWVKAL